MERCARWPTNSIIKSICPISVCAHSKAPASRAPHNFTESTPGSTLKSSCHRIFAATCGFVSLGSPSCVWVGVLCLCFPSAFMSIQHPPSNMQYSTSCVSFNGTKNKLRWWVNLQLKFNSCQGSQRTEQLKYQVALHKSQLSGVDVPLELQHCLHQKIPV